MLTEPVSPSEIAAVLDYSPETGALSWKNAAAAKVRGKTAGRADGKGYVGVRYKGRHYGAHRIAWAISHGEWPPALVDHINRDKTDNRLSNLRLATPAENMANRAPTRRNIAGAVGVTYCRTNKRWRATIKKGGRQVWGVWCETAEEAASARASVARQFFGKFAPQCP